MVDVERQYFLGIDGGASTISLAVIDGGGQTVHQQSISVGANYHALGLDQTIEHLESAVSELLDHAGQKFAPPFQRTVLGLAGCNFDSDNQILTRALRQSSLSSMLGGSFVVVNDSRTVLRAGTADGVGIVLISRAGSVCYGWGSDGQEGRAGGVDHILSDEGSGYDIGLRALRAVVSQLDGRGEQTLLTSTLFRILHVSSLEALHDTVYQSFTSKPQIASLATGVLECADKGDVIAKDILNHSVNELVRLVDAVIGQLGWQEESAPIVVAGNVATHPYIFSRLVTELKRISPHLQPARLDKPASVGAALMASEIS